MLMKHPIIGISLLAIMTICMPDGTFWEIASFSILAIATIITLYRWGIPRIQRCLRNRLYSISPPRVKTIEVGTNCIKFNLKVHRNNYVQTADIYFSSRRNANTVADSVIRKVNSTKERALGQRYKGENITMEINVEAKIPWCGYIVFLAFDEDGWASYCSHPIKVIASKSLIPDKEDSPTE